MQFDASHNSNIINYYYTNYSTCPKDPSYFATWHFLATFCHSILIIEIPLVILTGYCILKKTPRVMGSLKWAMLNVHFWSTYVDILMCSLLTPYIYFPTYSWFPLGLLRALGVPTSVQTYLGLSSIGFMFNSICALFENRSSSFKMNRFRFERNSTRFTFFISNAVLVAILVLPLFFILPDQDYAKFRCLEKLKCPTEEYFSSPVFVVLMNGYYGYYMTLTIGSQWLFTSLAALVFIFLTTYHIFYAKNGAFSENTKKLQKVFFIGNVVQIAIPSIFWAGPGSILSLFYYLNYHNQAFNNIVVAFVCLHGLVSMIAMLIIHHPYRTFIRRLIGVEDVVSPTVSNIIT